MIQVNKYPEVRFEHFDPNGNSLGFLNQEESCDLACQIVEQAVKNGVDKDDLIFFNSGYYLKHGDKIIRIKSNGDYSDYPRGFWDELLFLQTRKIKARRTIIDNE